ncbi:MAG: hypothetical protein E7631_12480 [Ruminococcaceae bacterium]|nr:hypothetical protein [Oscillospiraceae bacterium]
MKKLLCILLAALLASSVFVSCGESAAETDVTETSPAQTEPVETEPRLLDDLPDGIDLGGWNVNVLSGAHPEVCGDEICVEELNGDVINDAVYNRNLAVEKRLNVKITDYVIRAESGDFSHPDYAASEAITTLVTSGDTTYNLYTSNSYTTAALGYNHMLHNLREVKNLDLTKPYWAQYINETATVNGQQYLCTGPMSLGFFRFNTAMVFNKRLFSDNSLDYPYQTVLDGKWTLDTVNTLAEQIYVDTNGNGVLEVGEDTVGYSTRAYPDSGNIDGFWGSCNLRTISKDENDFYVYDVNVEHFVSVVDGLLALLNGEGSEGMAGNDGVFQSAFQEGKQGMMNITLNWLESGMAREMDDEYGVVPNPKLNTEQDNYYTLAQDQFLVYAIPLSVAASDLPNLGIFMEAFAAESYATVKPAYYEIALTAKYVNDQDSAAMLDIITNNVYVDPAILYLSIMNFNVMTLRDILGSGQNTAASRIASMQKQFQTNIDKINEAYGKEK